MLNVNINSPYPCTDKVYTNVLNKGGSKKIKIAFFDDDIPLDLSGANVTATFVTNGFLIAEDIEVSKVENTDNIVTLDISSNSAYTLIPGKMLVEFKFTKDNEELYPATAMCIYVKGSIRDNAKVTPESYGTVSEILREVAKARGDFTDLPSRLDDIDSRIENYEIQDGSVTTQKLADNAVKTAKINNGAVTGAKIAPGTIQSSNIGVGQIQSANIDGGAVTNNKLATNSVSTLKIQDEAVTEDKLADNAVTADKLSDSSVNTNKLADNSVTSDKILNGTVSLPKLASGAVTTSGSSAQAWAFANDYSLPTILLVKSWILNNIESLLKTTDYSIGFNDEGMAVKKTINKTLNIGEFGAETLKVYVSGQVTRIGANFFTTATNVTDIYIDNTEGEVELPAIPEGVTVHYKDEFKLSDSLVNSMVASNNEILAMRATVNEVNTTLENAINGVSE